MSTGSALFVAAAAAVGATLDRHAEVVLEGAQAGESLTHACPSAGSLAHRHSAATTATLCALSTQSPPSVQRQVEQATGATFNSCLLNQYRSGDDHMGWHSDNEPLYGQHPVIGNPGRHMGFASETAQAGCSHGTTNALSGLTRDAQSTARLRT